MIFEYVCYEYMIFEFLHYEYMSGLCFAGMLIHFRYGKFHALHMSTF